jgi:hypothetical protein
MPHIPNNIQPVVCTRCNRESDDIEPNEPAMGAHPSSYSPATICAEESNGEITWYLALHKPGCWMLTWATGNGADK